MPNFSHLAADFHLRRAVLASVAAAGYGPAVRPT